MWRRITISLAGSPTTGYTWNTLGYFQPWEPGNVDKTFTVTVAVS